jgi:DNA modification methylase
MEVNGRFGKCVFGDCLELLKDCEKFDVAFADPPYNVHTEKPVHLLNKADNEKGLRHGWISKENVIGYNNDFTDEEYHAFCMKWYGLLVDHADKVIITPGYNNEIWWRNNYPDLRVGIWIKRNAQNLGSFSAFARYEPILFHGNYKKKPYSDNFFDVYLDNGFLRGDMSLVHPHPKPDRLMEALLVPLEPVSVIDPFLGSGTTAYICEKYGYRWIGFEMMEVYKQDIEKQVAAGMREYHPRNKTAQMKVI